MYKKNHLKIKNIATPFILFFIIIFAVASCTIKPDTSNQTGQETTTESSNSFDAREVSPGDTIAGLKILSVAIEPGPDPGNEENYFAVVSFSGRLELSGKYISYSDQPLLGRSIIFYPDEDSSKLIPRLKHDLSEEVWFVFENYDKAAHLLSAPDSEGNAEIIIDNFTINYTLEAVNTADIADVINLKITKQPVQAQDTQGSTPKNNDSSSGATNLFDAREVKPGDIIMEMKVKTVDINSGENTDNYSAKVVFEGKAQISGTFKINNNDEFLGNLVSFIADEESAENLPKLSHDTRYTWFVFENTDKARDIFSSQGEEGFATILIDNYIINYAPSDVYNTAVLIDLSARG